MTVVSQFIDGPKGRGLAAAPLAFDTGYGLFTGVITAPDLPGNHGLRVVVADTTGGVTRHQRRYLVE